MRVLPGAYAGATGGEQSGDHALHGKMDTDQCIANAWMENDRDEEVNLDEYAWDDANNVELPIEQLREARNEEMKGRTLKAVRELWGVRGHWDTLHQQYVDRHAQLIGGKWAGCW